MKPTLTQRIARVFGFGRLPAALRRQLEAESAILYLAEGVTQAATLRNFRAPGVRCGVRKMGFVGSVVLTGERFLVKAGSYHHIDLDLALGDPRLQQIAFVREGDTLVARFDASLKGADYSGEVEIRLHLPDSDELVKALSRIGVRVESR